MGILELFFGLNLKLSFQYTCAALEVLSMIEGMADGGVKQGLPRDLSYKLAAYTFMGAAKMVLETGEHPAILKESVQSPGGSTVYGMHELEKGGMRGLLINAVEAASERSRATGRELLPRSPMDEEEEDPSNDDPEKKCKIKDNKPTIKRSR